VKRGGPGPARPGSVRKVATGGLGGTGRVPPPDVV
jgi:hypothetical protein